MTDEQLHLTPRVARVLMTEEAIYGLILDPHDVQQQLSMVIGLIPEEARKIITDQLSAITSQPRHGQKP